MRKLLLSLVSFVALCALIGCGTSNNTISIPPNPSGGNAAGFSNTSLASGTSYVFSVSGLNTTGSFAVVGTFVTDGNGNITAGTRDTVNDAGGQNLGEAIDTVNSSYFVNGDGRGQLVLTGPSGQVVYRFVLHAPTAQQPSLVGELFQDGTTSDRVIVDAVGIIEQVDPPAPAPPTGTTYIVRLDGEDSTGNPYGAIGGITITTSSPSGSTLTGLIDENDNGTFSLELSANATLPALTSRGTATLNTPTGMHNFIVYPVSSAHLELVSTDGNFLYGSATQQTSFAASNAAFASNQVFALSGVDDSGPQNSPASRVELGRLTLNGDGSLSNAIEDYSNFANIFLGGSLTQNSSYTVGANGRWTANLVNATYASSTALVGWQVSFDATPQDQKSFILTTNSNILETGVALGQTPGITDANVSGNYAESLSGFNVNGQEFVELTGNLNADGAGNFPSGTYDDQTDNTGLSLDTLIAGANTYNTGAATFGRSTAANLQNIPVAMYTVDVDTILFVSAQQGDIYQGAIINQQ
jgi:hypothetical protein